MAGTGRCLLVPGLEVPQTRVVIKVGQTASLNKKVWGEGSYGHYWKDSVVQGIDEL